MATQLIITQNPELAPGTCGRCLVGFRIAENGLPVREYWMDTNIQLEFEGRFYLCKNCCEDIVALMPGQITNSEYDALFEVVKEQDEKIHQFEKVKDHLETLGFTWESLQAAAEEKYGATTDPDDGSSDSSLGEADESDGDKPEDPPVFVTPSIGASTF